MIEDELLAEAVARVDPDAEVFLASSEDGFYLRIVRSLALTGLVELRRGGPNRCEVRFLVAGRVWRARHGRDRQTRQPPQVRGIIPRQIMGFKSKVFSAL